MIKLYELLILLGSNHLLWNLKRVILMKFEILGLENITEHLKIGSYQGHGINNFLPGIRQLWLTVAAPWFPVEAVMAPFVKRTSSFNSLRERSLLKAPLSLKDPVICSLSVITNKIISFLQLSVLLNSNLLRSLFLKITQQLLKAFQSKLNIFLMPVSTA